MEFSQKHDLLVITGPTASGKTSLAVAVAKKLSAEIISADSRQVYRGMNIGTGKDYDDFYIDGSHIPYHLMDIVEPGYKYNVFEYQSNFKMVYEDLKNRGVFPIVCGGSGLYIDSIIKGYKMLEVPPDSGLRAKLELKTMEELKSILSTYKSLHNTTDIDSKKRVIRAIEIEHFSRNKKNKKSDFPRIDSLIIGILYDRDERRKMISERLASRLDGGMVKEVEELIEKGVTPDTLVYYGLEYKYITLYLTGKLSYDKMVLDLEVAIHQFAKRQMTWFRGMEKRGTKINWIEGSLPLDEKVERIMELLEIGLEPLKKLMLPDN